MVMLILAVLVRILNFGNVGLDWGSDGYSDNYNETKFQDYANNQYAAAFGGSDAYEDNMLITVLVADDYYTVYSIAWVGDHINYQINEMMGNNDTALGQAMNNSISATNYKYSLDADLARVMQTMTGHAKALGLDNSYTCMEENRQIESYLINYSHLEMTEATVNEALAAFTEATGIPVVIVVEDMDEVFAQQKEELKIPSFELPKSRGIILAIMGVVLISALVIGVRAIRKKNEQLD